MRVDFSHFIVHGSRYLESVYQQHASNWVLAYFVGNKAQKFTMPLMVNRYIFEEMALRTLSKSTTRMRYIDDSSILYSHQEDVQLMLDHVNSIKASLQLTTEKEAEDKLTILDEVITHREYKFKYIISQHLPDNIRTWIPTTSTVKDRIIPPTIY